MVNRHQQDSTIIVGNSVAGSIPEVFLNNTKGDIVVTGEGEVSAYEAVEAIRLGNGLTSVEGISFRNSDGTILLLHTEKRKKLMSFLKLIGVLLMLKKIFKKLKQCRTKTTHLKRCALCQLLLLEVVHSSAHSAIMYFGMIHIEIERHNQF